MVKKVVLAYSGGLDTSIIISWLKEQYNCQVIAMAADVGQGEELKPLRKKAIATGASKIYIEDLRREFVQDFVWPMVRSGAVYEESSRRNGGTKQICMHSRQVSLCKSSPCPTPVSSVEQRPNG